MIKTTRLNAGWYQLDIYGIVFEVETTDRTTGGAIRGEWNLYYVDPDHDVRHREWVDTLPTLKYAKAYATAEAVRYAADALLKEMV